MVFIWSKSSLQIQLNRLIRGLGCNHFCFANSVCFYFVLLTWISRIILNKRSHPHKMQDLQYIRKIFTNSLNVNPVKRHLFQKWLVNCFSKCYFHNLVYMINSLASQDTETSISTSAFQKYSTPSLIPKTTSISIAVFNCPNLTISRVFFD